MIKYIGVFTVKIRRLIKLNAYIDLGEIIVAEFKKLYEDADVEVYKAPTEEELEGFIKEAIISARRPITWKELREKFSGIAGEDRLRKILIKLIERDEIIELPDGAFGLPGMEQNYIPRRTAKRVRPLVPSKFRARWGNMAARLRKAGLPLGEALKMFEKSGIRFALGGWEEYGTSEDEFVESEEI